MPELDSIRFLAIVLVVLHHQFFEDTALLSWFTDHGWVGVDIFFGMSGYLITTLLLNELNKAGTINLKRFWIRRMLRLWPSWGVTLLISFVMVWGVSRHNPEVREALVGKWWHYFMHVANYSYAFTGKIHTLYSHFWSLAVEEHFYLLWPLILFFVRSRRGVQAWIISLIVLCWGVRYYHLFHQHNEHLISFSTHTRIDQLLMGCLLAFYLPRWGALGRSLEVLLTVLIAVCFYLGLYVFRDHSSALLASLSYSVIGVGTCCLVVVALRGSRFGLRRLFQFRWTAQLGVLSYGVYLIHLHVAYVVFALLKFAPGVTDQTLIASINLLLPFVPAYFMFFYIDNYFARLKPHD